MHETAAVDGLGESDFARGLIDNDPTGRSGNHAGRANQQRSSRDQAGRQHPCHRFLLLFHENAGVVTAPTSEC
jgi:hypothetical protein